MYVKKEQALKNRYEFCCSKMKENVLVMQGMTMIGKANHTVFFSIDFNEVVIAEGDTPIIAANIFGVAIFCSSSN